MTPQQLHELGDPVGLLRPTQWENQPTVYGPAATAVEAAAAWLGGAAMAWIAFWIKVVNGIAYIAVAAGSSAGRSCLPLVTRSPARRR